MKVHLYDNIFIKVNTKATYMKNIIIIALLSTVHCSKTIGPDENTALEELQRFKQAFLTNKVSFNADFKKIKNESNKLGEKIHNWEKEVDNLAKDMGELGEEINQARNKVQEISTIVDSMQHKPLTLYSFFIEPWLALYTFLRSR